MRDQRQDHPTGTPRSECPKLVPMGESPGACRGRRPNCGPELGRDEGTGYLEAVGEAMRVTFGITPTAPITSALPTKDKGLQNPHSWVLLRLRSGRASPNVASRVEVITRTRARVSLICRDPCSSLRIPHEGSGTRNRLTVSDSPDARGARPLHPMLREPGDCLSRLREGLHPTLMPQHLEGLGSGRSITRLFPPRLVSPGSHPRFPPRAAAGSRIPSPIDGPSRAAAPVRIVRQ